MSTCNGFRLLNRRKESKSTRRSTMLHALVTFVCLFLILYPTKAFANTTITFPNGGTATLNSDGTITGTVTVGEWDDEWGLEYPVTFPDGTTTHARCIDRMHYAPAAGSYAFRATPNDEGSYSVIVDTSVAPHNVRQPSASYLLDPSQRLGELTWSPVVMGRIRVQKTSSMPFLSNNNGCYSLASARYSIWQDEACTKPVGAQYELITDAEGLSNEVELVPGDYWIKETQAPKGFKLDTTTYHITLDAGDSSTVHVQDTPLYDTPTVWAYKHDIDYTGAQGTGTLEGAEFTIRYYDIHNQPESHEEPTRTWVVRSDEAGRIMPTSDTLVSGGGLYRDSSGNVIIPLGTIIIQETKAPDGYWLEGQEPESSSGHTAPLHIVYVRNEGDYKAPRVSDSIKRAGISLQKVDKESYDVAQGGASLANICFSIINRNEAPVVVGGVVYYPGDSIPNALITDEKGYACTSANYLPLGTYEVVETNTNDSMLNTSSPQTVTLVEDQTNTLVSLDSPMVNDVVRGGIAIGKVSRETSDHVPQGAGKLEGAVFYVVLESEQPVLVNGEWYSCGDVVRELKTDECGIAQTGDRELPYGTYVVREVKAPTGYVLNDQWSQTVSISEDGVVVDCTDTDSSADDQIVRGGLTFNKVDGRTMDRMSGVAWSITSTTTHESHVVVTDKNGVVNTETQSHSLNTNANDFAVVDGEVRDDLLDPTAGLWFSGTNDVTTTPMDDFCALPYDTYVVQELPSSANEGYELVWFTVHITNHNETVDLGTIDNTRILVPSLATTLAYDGSDHVAPVDGEVVLVDTIAYEDLDVDESYVLVGNLINVETYIETQSEEQSTIATSLIEDFEPDLPSGTTHVTFTLDSSELCGKTIVAFEHLRTSDDIEVASHAVVDDKNQSVWFPNIKTTLAVDKGSLADDDNEHITLVDTVSYKNLVPGLWYRMEGVLMDKYAEEAVFDTLGNVVRTSKSFMPSEQEGTTDLFFTIDQTSVQGKTLVAFETLLRNDTPLVHHEDLNDHDQTVLFPSIRTELTDRDGNKVLPEGKTIELVDTVSFINLEVGTTYELEGMLVDKLTGEPLLDEAKIPLIRTRSFTPEHADGTTTIEFNVESANVGNGEIVAFETLRRAGHDVCWHRDADDEAQTVRFPSIHTTLASPAGTHESIAAQVTLTDVVSFSGLKPNEQYVLEGTLVDRDTQKPITNADGTQLMVRRDFEPEASEGIVEVPFKLDATSLEGHTLVAYETLFAKHENDSQEIAQHADLNDTNQTVVIPRISTSAVNAENGKKSILLSDKAHIRDTVTYQNLCVDASYVMTGTLHNKSTGKAIEQSVVTKSFTPTERNGTVDLDFVVDSSTLGEGDVVVFESCTRDGIEVAFHKDLNDENQTVSIRKGTAQRNEHTPGTGDPNTGLLVIALTSLGVSVLIARRVLAS